MKPIDDTIAAIATPPGTSGVGIVRVSGPKALSIADAIFIRTSKRSLESHKIYHGEIINPNTNEIIDSALLLTFFAPNSYTGQDVVEFSCHGGTATLSKVLDLCRFAGARMAEPGEFTQRAFINGKMDLAQAEAVADIINAKTEAQRKSAMLQHKGKLSQSIREMRETLISIIAEIEAGIDFGDEIGELDYSRTAEKISQIALNIQNLLETAQNGRLLREGVRAAIMGRPNVGKSSLLNALIGDDRAIVTPIPGATRDVIDASTNINGLVVNFSDTAGLRETNEVVESIGIKRAHETAECSDLILFVISSEEGLTEEDLSLFQRFTASSVIPIVNKWDLIQPSERSKRLEDYASRFETYNLVSAKTGEGLDDLRTAIYNACIGGQIETEFVLINNARHQEALELALASLNLAMISTQEQMPPDFIAVDITAAANALGHITGETVTEDIIDRIFSNFCIGK